MHASDTNTVLQVIFEQLEKVNDEKIALSAETDITTDLHVDSLAVMELVFELEERFDVTIPLNELGDVRTIGQIAQLVESKREGHAA